MATSGRDDGGDGDGEALRAETEGQKGNCDCGEGEER